MSGWFRDGEEAHTSWSVTGSELLTRSAFRYATGADGGPLLSVWGRGALSRFDGRDEELTLRGEVAAGTLGADVERGGWLAGLALSHSEGEGTFSMEGSEGEIESSLTGLYPYLRYALTERLSVWGVAGYGAGTLMLTGEGEDPIETDIDLTMGAGGARGELLSARETGGFALALETDALRLRSASEAARTDSDRMKAARADVSRLRLRLESSYAFEIDGGGSLTPSLEVGVRHDGGDAETGFGLELGGGLLVESPRRGLTAQMKVRSLLAHEESGFEEWGASGSVGYDPHPSSALGPSLGLSVSRGATSGGADALWRRRTMAGIVGNDEYTPGAGLEADFGYGFSAFGGRAVATPSAGASWSETGEALRLGVGLGFGRSKELELEGAFGGGERTLRLGYGYRLGRSLELNVEGIRRESAGDDGAPEHRILLRGRMRF